MIKKKIIMKIDKELKKKLSFIGKIILISSILSSWIVLFIDFNVMYNNNKTSMWIHCPSMVVENEDFEITVEAWDRYERLAGGYNGKVSFGIESYNYTSLEEIKAVSDLPNDYEFTSNFIWKGLVPAYNIGDDDNGKRTFIIKISTPGIHYIKLKEKNTLEKYRSNPIIVKPENIYFKNLFWGDLHGHTSYSDGSGTPEEAYEFARDVALLDFAALTDHSEMFPRLGDVDLLDRFQNYIDITNEFNDDGEFATIVAMEWTPWISGRGTSFPTQHINIYFENDDMPFYSSLTHSDPEEIYKAIEKESDDQFLSWTHHSIRSTMPSDFGFYDEDINTMAEIYSCHGSCECAGKDNLYTQAQELDGDGYSIRDALKMGRKFGLMASGDSHDGRLGHSISHTNAQALNQQPYTAAGYRYGTPYPNGLTGIYSDTLDRNSIFKALQKRSAYATTWINRHYIEFSINGLTVGVNDSTLQVPKLDFTREITILLCADGISLKPNKITKIEEVEIFKNSELWKIYENLDESLVKITENDTSLITGTEYEECIKREDDKWYIHERSIKPVDPDDLDTNGVDYYYVRMQDSEGGAAWIGPIWVEVS